MYNPTVQSIISSFLEKILEWDGSLDEFSIELSTHFPLFSDNNLDSIEKEMLRSAKTYFSSKKHRDVMKLLDQPLRGDISGIQDAQSYNPEYNIIFLTAMTMNELLDLSWKPQTKLQTPKTKLQAPRTKIKLLIYKVILNRIPVIDHLSP